MEIRCDCGKFRAELKMYPKNTPGRLICYCDDCQSYLHHLKRADLLDINGGSEIIPAYPADVQIVSGQEYLMCSRLSPKGMFRFSTSCCNTPVANIQPNFPWIGFHRRVYSAGSADVENELGPVRGSIMGRYAKGTPPAGTPQNMNLKSFISVVPFLLKGKLFGKSRPSPFFAEDGVTPISPVKILTKEERQSARNLAGV